MIYLQSTMEGGGWNRNKILNYKKELYEKDFTY